MTSRARFRQLLIESDDTSVAHVPDKKSRMMSLFEGGIY